MTHIQPPRASIRTHSYAPSHRGSTQLFFSSLRRKFPFGNFQAFRRGAGGARAFNPTARDGGAGGGPPLRVVKRPPRKGSRSVHPAAPDRRPASTSGGTVSPTDGVRPGFAGSVDDRQVSAHTTTVRKRPFGLLLRRKQWAVAARRDPFPITPDAYPHRNHTGNLRTCERRMGHGGTSRSRVPPPTVRSPRHSR